MERAAGQVDPAQTGLERGLTLLAAGAWFEAHEAFEEAWRAAPPAERDFLQGLVHVAVAWLQAGRGRRIGCERQLAKATRRLGPYAPRHRGVDVAGVLAQLAVARSAVAGGSLTLAPVAPIAPVERAAPAAPEL